MAASRQSLGSLLELTSHSTGEFPSPQIPDEAWQQLTDHVKNLLLQHADSAPLPVIQDVSRHILEKELSRLNVTQVYRICGGSRISRNGKASELAQGADSYSHFTGGGETTVLVFGKNPPMHTGRTELLASLAHDLLSDQATKVALECPFEPGLTTFNVSDNMLSIVLSTEAVGTSYVGPPLLHVRAQLSLFWIQETHPLPSCEIIFPESLHVTWLSMPHIPTHIKELTLRNLASLSGTNKLVEAWRQRDGPYYKSLFGQLEKLTLVDRRRCSVCIQNLDV
ncbi:hypothetical protein K461DRAFT_281400 [Myriangium duriaei CBS 260.36]|uniref:Uncharacterized protein n=1 Tax=Myriangium duriaei CBS 260.36 TaxID=1168546 RepID=A0A9P4MEN1_9PEZI|nr:hypothetical protein K461DRAFT_281400 [Myriangium duriaei CBS 260.36]